MTKKSHGHRVEKGHGNEWVLYWYSGRYNKNSRITNRIGAIRFCNLHGITHPDLPKPEKDAP